MIWASVRPLAQIDKFMMMNLNKFNINNISKKLNKINSQITLSHNVPFPHITLLSHYRFKKRYVHILPNGGIQGGYTRMITSLLDFSFIRSLVAKCYSDFGPPPYDPATLFLLDLFRYIDGYRHMSQFIPVLHDKDRGRAYRSYAGIHDNIPCAATYSNFRSRIGETLYNEIFHVLIDIFHQLEMITFSILSTDGTLYPSWARYKGCCYFCDGCEAITVSNIIEKVRERIIYRVNNFTNHNFGSECRVTIQCSSNRFPDDIKKPQIELFAFKLSFCDGNPTREQKNTACFFGVENILEEQHLCINTIRSHIIHVGPIDGSITIRCPKLPKDVDAKMGVRRNPQNPNKKQKIFGYDGIYTTSVELHLGIELPVAADNIAGNAKEGDYFIKNAEQIYSHHFCNTKISLADSKYDIIKNYKYARGKGAIPIIDYNVRKENLKKKNILQRGYDQNGWPFAPCGLLCRPNGFDEKRQRLTSCCFKQCLKLKYQAIKNIQSQFDIGTCPHVKKQTGFVKHMYIKEHPRLINVIPRGSKRYKEIKKLRSSSERINSLLKEDLHILDKPIVLNIKRANILVQIGGIVLLLKRTFAFVVKITILARKHRHSSDQTAMKNLLFYPIPKSILNIIQHRRE